MQSFLKVYTANIGINASNVLSMSLNLPEARYPTARSAISFFDNLKGRLEAMPGVESVAIADAFPTAGSRHNPYEIDGTQAVDEQKRPRILNDYSRFAVLPNIGSNGSLRPGL